MTRYPNILLRKRQGAEDKIDWFEVAEPCRFDTMLDPGATLPAGYVTDFASVPRLLWNMLPPHDRMTNAAILHDYKYDNQLGEAEHGAEKARLIADIEFGWDCAASGVPKWQIMLVVAFIRIFGKKWWNK
jgi:hypothetical protein